MKTREIILQTRTLLYLRPRQIFYYVIRRFLPARHVSLPDQPQVREFRRIKQPCAVTDIFVNETTFKFLNSTVDLTNGGGDLNWSPSYQSKLWLYNLHYFDYLREAERPDKNKDYLIRSWIRNNPQGRVPGWEPFATSLRIVNWCHYILYKNPGSIPPDWIDSLFLQALWLERNDEKHILANHYFENLKALLYAGCLFQGAESDRWINRAIEEIIEQVDEQTLSDGGHYERSPLYHTLMLENYLDIYNLSRAYPDIFHPYFVQKIQSAAIQGLDWLASTLFPDGNFALFNDSAFGISVPPIRLFSYAEQLGLPIDRDSSTHAKIINRPASGLYGYRGLNDMFIIDCGEIGPRYQPGHTHCDFLSYELMLSRRRIIVDTGVSGYEPGMLRQYVRSTKAHNTVSVDGGEQSEVWNSFRIARRAKKLRAQIKRRKRRIEFHGSFQGFYTISGRIEHRRGAKISLSANRERIQNLIITDEVLGTGYHKIESFIHLHPDVSVNRKSANELELMHSGARYASILLAEDQPYRIEQGVYCPEFGKVITNQQVILSADGQLPVSLQYEIEVNLI
jgi:uncharacterized heparinase superfamily protein